MLTHVQGKTLVWTYTPLGTTKKKMV